MKAPGQERREEKSMTGQRGWVPDYSSLPRLQCSGLAKSGVWRAASPGGPARESLRNCLRSSLRNHTQVFNRNQTPHYRQLSESPLCRCPARTNFEEIQPSLNGFLVPLFLHCLWPNMDRTREKWWLINHGDCNWRKKNNGVRAHKHPFILNNQEIT